MYHLHTCMYELCGQTEDSQSLLLTSQYSPCAPWRLGISSETGARSELGEHSRAEREPETEKKWWIAPETMLRDETPRLP